MRTQTLTSTLRPLAVREGTFQTALYQAGLALAGSAVLWLSAKIQVPFYPVPMTFQTMAVLLLGMAYGPRLGMATVLLYLTEGLTGLPVFAGTPEKGLGLAYILGPTGGYLIGFVLAAGVCGFLAQRGWDRRIPTMAAALGLGNLALYLPGLLWLGTLLGWDKPILAWGLYPFILGDLAKLVLASAAMPLLWKAISRR